LDTLISSFRGRALTISLSASLSVYYVKPAAVKLLFYDKDAYMLLESSKLVHLKSSKYYGLIALFL